MPPSGTRPGCSGLCTAKVGCYAVDLRPPNPCVKEAMARMTHKQQIAKENESQALEFFQSVLATMPDP